MVNSMTGFDHCTCPKFLLILGKGILCSHIPLLLQNDFTDLKGQDKKNYGDGIAEPEVPLC